MLVYWVGSELYLIDAEMADLALWLGILISAASLTVGWLIYDFLCKSGLGERPTLLLFVLLVAVGWGYNQIFTGRAMMQHLGAFTATIMTANVYFIIMPNQRIVVDDLKNGRTPDPKYGKIDKLRSTHNNYLTLPVVFLMGTTIRHYFNTRHARAGNPTWTWAVAAMRFIAIMWLSTAPMYKPLEEAEMQPLTPYEQKFAAADGFEDAHDVVLGRCSMCHAREPVWEGIQWAPKGVLLETEGDIARNARQIYLQTGVSHTMPPANVTCMEPEDRDRPLVQKCRVLITTEPINSALFSITSFPARKLML